MTVDRTLRALLDRSDAIAIAFDPKGASTVALPEPLGPMAASTIASDGPLEFVATDSYGRAVAAFERAKRRGKASSTVSIVGKAEEYSLEVFDLTEAFGCFVAVAVPGATDGAGADGESAKVPDLTTYELSPTGVFLTVGPHFNAIFGWDENDVIGRSVLEFIHPDEHEDGIATWIELLERPRKQLQIRRRMLTKAGDWIWCETIETNLLDEAGRVCVTSRVVDLSQEMAAQVALQQREQLLERLNEALPTGVLQLSADGRVVVHNRRWTELIGSAEGDGLVALLEHLVDTSVMEDAVEDSLANGTDADLSVAFDGAGRCRFGKLHIRPLQQGGVITGLLMTLEDVTKLQTYQLELAEQARRDALTGAYNRLGIEDLIEQRLHDGSVDDRGLSVLFIDLDRFKAVNDEFGHLLGDRVLKAVVTAIQGHLRPDDKLGRMGGDEFLVILGPDAGGAVTATLVDRIRGALAAVADQFEEPVSIGASIGVAVGCRGDSFDSILKRADTEMYREKRSRDDQPSDRSQPDHR